MRDQAKHFVHQPRRHSDLPVPSVWPHCSRFRWYQISASLVQWHPPPRRWVVCARVSDEIVWGQRRQRKLAKLYFHQPHRHSLEAQVCGPGGPHRSRSRGYLISVSCESWWHSPPHSGLLRRVFKLKMRWIPGAQHQLQYVAVGILGQLTVGGAVLLSEVPTPPEI